MLKLDQRESKRKPSGSKRSTREHRVAYQLLALDAAWPKIDAYATELVASGQIKSTADLMAHRPLNQLLGEFHRQIERLNREFGCIQHVQARQ